MQCRDDGGRLLLLVAGPSGNGVRKRVAAVRLNCVWVINQLTKLGHRHRPVKVQVGSHAGRSACNQHSHRHRVPHHFSTARKDDGDDN
jgi:hypothetical protein